MINKITVSENRGLYPIRSNLGTIGEKNATTLLFLLPSSLQGYNKNIVCVTAQGSFNYEVLNDTFDLPSEVLTDNTLKLQLILRDGDKVIWKSIPYTFTLNPTLDDSGENIVEKSKSEQREVDRSELGGALTELTGKDVGGEEWDALVDSVKSLSLLSDEEKAKLELQKHISFLFERSTQPPSILYGDYAIEEDDFEENPDYVGGDDLITTPYLLTPKALFSAGQTFSDKLQNIEMDVSGVNSTFNRSTKNTSSVAWFKNTNVKKMVLTGVQNIANMAFLFNGSPLVELTLLETGEKREEVTYTNGWEWTFNNCLNLSYILGTPLDMTRSNGSSGYNMFNNCTKLRYVGFKPRTISGSFSMNSCSQLTQSNMEAVIQVLNGCRDWVNAGTPSCMVTFNSSLKADFQNNKCRCSEKTGDYVSAEKYALLDEDQKADFGPEIDYINAFAKTGEITSLNKFWYRGKGVNLQWSL